MIEPDLLIEYILYIFSTCLLRAFVPLFWGIFLLVYNKNFWQNIGVSCVFLPIGILYLFDSFLRLPSLSPCDVYDVRSYLVFICLPPFAKFYANYAFNIKISKLAHLLHFIPFAVMLSLYLLLVMFNKPHIPFCSDINTLLGYAAEYPLYVIYYLMLMALFSAQVFFYAVPATIRLWQIRKLHLNNDFPVKNINQLFVVILSFSLYPFVCMMLFSYYNNIHVLVAHNFSLPVFVTVISLFVMDQRLPLKTSFKQHNTQNLQNIANNRFITADEKLLKQFIELFENKEFYKQPDLTLQYLAKKLGTSRHILSSVIIKHYGCNFKQLHTKRRLETAKKLLADKDFDIQQVAYEAGFNSRSAFYEAFKENVSSELSPLKWRKQNIN